MNKVKQSSQNKSRNLSALWIGGTLGPYERLALSSAIKNGYQLNLYTYDECSNIPEGTILRDANKIVPRSKVFENKRQKGTFAAFANIFRYQLLNQFSTTWIDCDIVVFQREFPVSDYLFGYESRRLINNAVLHYPKNSVLAQTLINRSNALDPANVTWGELGPRLLTEALSETGLDKFAQEQSTFYPIKGSEIWKIFDPKQTERMFEVTQNSCALHLWNEVLRTSPHMVKYKKPITGSFIEFLFHKYEIETEFDEDLDVTSLQEWRQMFENRGQKWRRFGQKLRTLIN